MKEEYDQDRVDLLNVTQYVINGGTLYHCDYDRACVCRCCGEKSATGVMAVDEHGLDCIVKVAQRAAKL